MLELREFDLQFAFFAAGALRENIENERSAIQNFAAENFFEIAALRGRKFVVENDCIDILFATIVGELLRLAAADESRRDRRLQFLRAIADDIRACASGEFVEFIHGIAQFKTGARFEFEADEENPFGAFVVRDECFQFLIILVSEKVARIARDESGFFWGGTGVSPVDFGVLAEILRKSNYNPEAIEQKKFK